MPLKLFKWLKLCDDIEQINWQSNNLAVVEVDGRSITLAKSGENFSACAHKCPHASGILAEGFIDATGNIVCPLHRYKFNLINGRNVSGEGYYLKVYQVEHRGDGFYIGLEETAL